MHIVIYQVKVHESKQYFYQILYSANASIQNDKTVAGEQRGIYAKKYIQSIECLHVQKNVFIVNSGVNWKSKRLVCNYCNV
jgi:hypothetical protein